MTIRQIADQVAFYLQRTRAAYQTTEGNDFIIGALNSARKKAELQHDFVNHQAQAWLSVDPVSGAAMSTAKLVTGDTETATSVRIKAVDTAYMRDAQGVSPTWWPIWVDPKKLLAIKTKERNYRYRGYPSQYGAYGDDPLVRYAGDFSTVYISRPFRGYFLGQDFFLDPAPTAATTVRMDVQLWGDEYEPNLVLVQSSSTSSATVTVSAGYPSNFVGSTFLGQAVLSVVVGIGVTVTLAGNANETIATPTWRPYVGDAFPTGEAYTDWFTVHGSDYLLWSAVVDCNMFARQFVPRETGYLSPPEKMRDEALSRLIMWDDFQWEQGRQPLAIR